MLKLDTKRKKKNPAYMCVFRVKVGHHTGIRKKKKKKNQQARVIVLKELKLVTTGKKKKKQKKRHVSVSRVLKTGHC